MITPAQQILGMKIFRDRKVRKVWLSQEKYVERVIAKFNVKYVKHVSTLLVRYFKLRKNTCPSSKEERENMEAISYSSAVGSLIYATVSTWLDIARIVSVARKFPSNPVKDHWKVVTEFLGI
ncbi:hypothetical protein U1Q18_052512 [Sarracenia purpurea var. burkii]